jgi:hypothetical protein
MVGNNISCIGKSRATLTAKSELLTIQSCLQKESQLFHNF